MAIIDIDSIIHLSGSILAVWTGDGYLFLEGELTAGPDTESTLPDRSLVVEVHDQNTDPYEIQPQLHPLIQWRPVSGSYKYYVYQTAPGGSEAKIYEEFHDDDKDLFSVRCPRTCENGWHFFRVLAVDSVGNVADVDAWPEIVLDIPEQVGDIDIAGGSGTFTITIGE